MLFNPKWDKRAETKADPFDIRTLLAWLEKQPAKRRYDWGNCKGECLFGQYMAAHGIAWSDATYLRLSRLVGIEIARETPWTFGAALERARALT